MAEQAPPAPPQTPQVYMTPYLSKRRDGICPSLLSPTAIDPKASNPGGMSKNYQTKSNLLLQVACAPGQDKAAQEFQSVIDNVKDALEEMVAPTEDIVDIHFSPTGCQWSLELSPSLNGADQSYFMAVVCLANDGHAGNTNYVVDVRLTPKGEIDANPLAAPLKGYREAKVVFDVVSLQVRKAIVQMEFPEFPEGCKGKAFRDVYQLNARVSSCSAVSWRSCSCCWAIVLSLVACLLSKAIRLTPCCSRLIVVYSSSQGHLPLSAVVPTDQRAERSP